MKKIIVFLTFIINSSAWASDHSLDLSIDKHQSEFENVAMTIWDLAEVGYQEYESSQLLQKSLKDHGFKIQTNVADIPTAFIAEYGSGSPVIAILGEFDALPGVAQSASPFKEPYKDNQAGHACGHHLFAAGSAWSSVGLFGSSQTHYFLVIDGWDNERFSDRGAAGGTINVEVLVDVEERTTLPNFIAYILISALPIACIIGPLIIHSRYMKMGLSNEEDSRQMPYLDDESDQRSGED